MAKKIVKPLFRPLLRFIQGEINSGFILFFVTVAALIVANSPLSDLYFQLFEETHISIDFQLWKLDKPLYYWINDGLMAIFFFLVGMEMKREIMIGELSSPKKALLPILAAVGGMAVPALVYVGFTLNDPAHMDGWAIPMATDIAFALGVLSLLGKRVPLELKIFLTSLAIVDDLGAVLTIAAFYTETIKWTFLAIALGAWLFLFLLNRLGVRAMWVFIAIGIFFVWYPLLKSGVHATIAGVLVAFAIPMARKYSGKTFVEKMKSSLGHFAAHSPKESEKKLNADQYEALDDIRDHIEEVSSPLQTLEHNLHKVTLNFVMPVFAFANAGIAFNEIDFGGWLGQSLSLGIMGGLVLGKVLGIAGFTFLGLKLGWIKLPESLNMRHIIGAGFLAGIGFTMSIFITELAFHGDDLINYSKLSILVASILAGAAGFFILRQKKTASEDAASD